MSSPFNMDMAAQSAQTQTFQGLVESTMANNKNLEVIADGALTANRGSMSNGFQVWMADLKAACMHNNQVLESMTEALGFGIQSTDTTEQSNNAELVNLTGQISSPFGGGSQFT